ncbi:MULTISPECIES: ABC transporter permease [Nocardiopsis]|uniref:ABC-2 type transporter n=1 Tax=Nocardiopsis dassonvillei (strain ATCC 23218 / DSM 43111 / CIP 107115 / JCM 7437 / KCTC 9190 / NBRC 14626 / NCTC 10488 / NRRL B-5397 / IMRU 509) TaxID=446468 RepID=D7AZA9_NOCDD|nr:MULTISPECIES: ABC transporter permease [Nocardiopsis]ADH70089.1 ABC-2 type transporter [Nocardiopsis dassonvillei subsp. dassonvillei DSM 43111]ASU60989.1 ABC transporter permease [Nocardiopsis dassonvillei]NKY80602.1 ABC transporter permease [Nocardiopsis dassonvillei]VEI90604.1 Inner membrane transport permease ybhS [Nocardiopsis dassonvillei]
MKSLTIGVLNVRRVFRDRTNIFFVLLLPFLMVFMMGLMYGEGKPVLGVVAPSGGGLAERLVGALEEDERIDVLRLDETEMRDLVEAGDVQAGLVVPDDYGDLVRDGGQVELELVTRGNDWAAADVGTWVRSVVAQESALLSTARVTESVRDDGFEERLADAEETEVSGVRVEVVTAGEATFPEGVSSHSLAAPPLLLLYTFITALTTSLGIVQARRSGVLRRLYASPTSAGSIVLGEALGRFLIALTQALLILFGSALLFGVAWGNLFATSLVVTAFCLVSSGASLLLGSLARTEGGALAAAVGISLGAGALGGTMLPLESFGDTMTTIAFLTPHAWGYDAFSALVRDQASLVDVLPHVGVLLGYAAVLLALGVWRFRAAVTR